MCSNVLSTSQPWPCQRAASAGCYGFQCEVATTLVELQRGFGSVYEHVPMLLWLIHPRAVGRGGKPTCQIVSSLSCFSPPRNRFYIWQFWSVTFSVVQGLTAVVGPCATSACKFCAASINRIFENPQLTPLNSWPGLVRVFITAGTKMGLVRTWRRIPEGSPLSAASLTSWSGGISVERSLGVCGVPNW